VRKLGLADGQEDEDAMKTTTVARRWV